MDITVIDLSRTGIEKFESAFGVIVSLKLIRQLRVTRKIESMIDGSWLKMLPTDFIVGVALSKSVCIPFIALLSYLIDSNTQTMTRV